MRITILEISAAFLISILLYLLFMKFAIIRAYRKYNYEIGNRSAVIYSVAASVTYVLVFTAISESVFSSYKLLKSNVLDRADFWSSFLPLFGQYLMLLIAIFICLKLLAQYIYKWFFVKKGLLYGIENDNRTGILLFSTLLLSLTWLVRYFVIQKVR